jgi:hypothetical protein
MDLDRIVVATITRARDSHEEGLIARTLAALAALGCPVVASDGGSSRQFLQAVIQVPGVILVPPDHPGLTGQVKASVRRAREFDREWVLYLESDKELFVRESLRDFIAAAARHTDAAVILASRSDRAFGTFPAFQRRTESAFNAVASDVIGGPRDYLYGPFLMRQSLAVHVDRVSADLGWGWRPYIFAVAGRGASGIRAVDGDHACPAEQVPEDHAERLHRVRQLAQNIDGLARAMAESTFPPGPLPA